MALDSGSPCRNDGFHAKMRIAAALAGVSGNLTGAEQTKCRKRSLHDPFDFAQDRLIPAYANPFTRITPEGGFGLQ